MIRSVWLAFWAELNTPSNYAADPYGGFTNQASHWAVGIAAAAATCLLFGLLAGEMPPRWGVWLAVTLGYAVWIEKIKQEWAGPDSIVDTGFVALGAALPLASLKETAFRPRIALELHAEAGLAVLAGSAIALLAYVYPRLKKWRNAEGP